MFKKNHRRIFTSLEMWNEILRKENEKLLKENEQLMKAELTLIWYMEEYLQETDPFYLILNNKEKVDYTICKVRELEEKIYKQTKELIESESDNNDRIQNDLQCNNE